MIIKTIKVFRKAYRVFTQYVVYSTAIGGFQEDKTDLITNYDIKCRMGKESTEADKLEEERILCNICNLCNSSHHIRLRVTVTPLFIITYLCNGYVTARN